MTMGSLVIAQLLHALTCRASTQGRPGVGPNLPLAGALGISFAAQGAILQGGAAVAQLRLSGFKTPSQLVKQGANYFAYDGDPADIQLGSGQVQQGKLEGSNVAPAESAVRLVSVMRQFEMLQKAISIGTEMNKQAVEEVARSGQ